MVFPLMMAIGAAAGAGGNLISGLMGNAEQKRADEQNYRIALMNYYQRESERQQAIAEAHRQEKEGKLGYTDAQGNRVYYKEGVGWVTELSPKSKEMQALQEKEQQQTLIRDLPARREQMYKNLARQGREENVAGGLMEAMMRNYREDPEATINRRNLMSTQGITEGMDTALDDAMRKSVREGSSNAGSVAASIGRERSDMLRKAMLENAEGARDASENKYFTEQGNLSNLYNTFATRASAMPDVNYSPWNVTGGPDAMMGSAAQAGDAREGNLLNAIGKQGGTLQYKQEPNMNLATTIAQLGSGIAGSANYFDSLGYGQGGGGSAFSRAGSQGGGGIRSSDYYKQNVGPW